MAQKVVQILTVAGVAFLLLGGIMLVWMKMRPASFTVTDAEVVNTFFSEATDKIELNVRFEADGETVEHHTQPIAQSQLQCKAGDRIRIAYRCEKVLGIRTWRIYAGEDALRADQKTQTLNALASVAVLLAGAVMLVAAVWISRTKG